MSTRIQYKLFLPTSECGWEKLKGNGNEIQLESGVGGRGWRRARKGRIQREIFDVYPAQIFKGILNCSKKKNQYKRRDEKSNEVDDKWRNVREIA